jgi:hypothetical protein
MGSHFPRPQRPTGIIRTLPYFGAEDSKHNQAAMNSAYREMMRAFKAMETDDERVVWIAFPHKPTIEVLHCYIIVGGKVRVRANIAYWLDGTDVGEVECWDKTNRCARWWAELTGPVSWPPEEMLRRGFQGFRYTEELW